MPSAFNFHEFSGNREAFLEEEVRRLEAELNQREQDYEDLLKEAREVCQIQVEFQDSTEKTIESKDQEIASLTGELTKKTKELEETSQQLNDAITAALDKCRARSEGSILNAERRVEDTNCDCQDDAG